MVPDTWYLDRQPFATQLGGTEYKSVPGDKHATDIYIIEYPELYGRTIDQRLSLMYDSFYRVLRFIGLSVVNGIKTIVPYRNCRQCIGCIRSAAILVPYQ